MQYYFQADIFGRQTALALVSVYGRPVQEFLQQSHGTLQVLEYYGNTALRVINVKCIQSVVAMVPFPVTETESNQHIYDNHFFVGEKFSIEFTLSLNEGNNRNNTDNNGDDQESDNEHAEDDPESNYDDDDMY